MLPRTHRLPLSSGAKHTARLDFSIEGEFLRIRFQKNALGHLRCAVTVPKRAFLKAAQRNRVKRALHGAIERIPNSKSLGYDVAIWVKKGSKEQFKEVKEVLVHELEGLFSKIGRGTRKNN